MASKKNRTALEQVTALFRSIPRRQLILIGSSALAIGAAVFGFSYWKRNSDFRPLYQSLSPEDAGTVVAKLKEKNIPFRLSSDGATVSVPEDKVAEERLEMAAAGLPKTGRIGFELFDQTKFGATDFMEHVNYRRALEGELERTLDAMSEVEKARVHLTFSRDSVFTENRLPAKGSVVLKLKSALSERTVSAIRYMVASAVEGLSPEQVTVVDMAGNLLGRPKEKTSEEDEAPEKALEYRRNVEKDLLAKVNSTLEPLLGPDRFRSAVVADCDFTSGEAGEETFDPNRSVMTTDQHSVETNVVGQASGLPGTQSNLPGAVARPSTSNHVTRESSNTNYQTTRSYKRTKLPQGTLKRLSVSVVLDEPAHWEGRGANLRRVTTPPSQQTLDRITQLVSAAAGIVPERGDRVVVESLPFETTREDRPPDALKEPAPGADPSWMKKLIGGVALLVLAGVIGTVIYLNKKPGRKNVEEMPVALTAGTPEPSRVLPAQSSATQLAKQLEAQRLKEQERQMALEAAGAALQKLVEGAVEMSQTNSELCAGVLRGWMNERPNEKQEPVGVAVEQENHGTDS
jgi:flagellar M-ring protein FliF